MPVTNDTYDQLKIDKLKHFLEAQAEKGQAKPFEIFVDNLKVVSKTEDPKEFDNYEFYMNEDTEKVRILIYNSNLSPRNDQYCFQVQKNLGGSGKSLNGLGEVENLIQEKLAARDREHEMNRLREELEATKLELEESEDYADQLEKEIQYLKENKFKLGNINIAEFGAAMLEGIVRKNPHLLAKFPGGEALAGLIEQDNLEKEKLFTQPQQPESKVTFQKETSVDVTEKEKQQLAYLRKVEQAFTGEQAELFNLILHVMAEKPSLMPDILELINPKQ